MQDRPQHPAVRGELVDGRRRRRRKLPLLDQAVELELLESAGQDVGPDAGQRVDEVGVALGSVEELTDDEQGPPLTDEVEGVGDRAVLVVALHDFRFCTMRYLRFKYSLVVCK